MTRPDGESGLDGLGINEDDLILADDLADTDVPVVYPEPVSAQNRLSEDPVIPIPEADPGGWKRALIVFVPLGLIAAGTVALLIYGVATWSQ